MEMLLKKENLWKVINDTSPATSESAAHLVWTEKDEKALALLAFQYKTINYNTFVMQKQRKKAGRL